MKKLLATLLLSPILVLAQQVNYTFKTSNDNSVQLNSHTTSVVFKNWGIGVSKNNYETLAYSKNSSGLLFIADKRADQYSLVGNIGIGTSSNKHYLLGDISGTYTVNKNVTVNSGIFGDLIDGSNALINNISAQGLTIGGDISYDTSGFAFGYKSIWYSNDNQQKGYFLKPFYSIADGMNVYMIRKYYTNSNPNLFYFSPDVYTRQGLGINFRQRFGSTVLYGFIENTKIKTSFNNDSTMTWKIGINTPLYDKIKVKLSVSRDFNNGFQYKYLESTLIYEF